MKVYRSAGKYATALYWYTQKYFDKRLARFGIGPGQLPILMCLYRQDNISQEYIARDLQIDKTTIARSIKRLEKEEYIVREIDPSDRRSYCITLTEKARKNTQEILKISNEWTAKLIHNMSSEEQEQFFYLLAKATENGREFLQGNDNDE